MPIEQTLGQGSMQEISFKMVKRVMNHFKDCNEVVRHFTKRGEDKSSSDDDLSSPFSIFINL